MVNRYLNNTLTQYDFIYIFKYFNLNLLIFKLIHSYSQLLQYKDKFKLRFSASNLLHLNQLIYVIENFIIILGNPLFIVLYYIFFIKLF